MLNQFRYFSCSKSIFGLNLRHVRDFRGQARTRFSKKLKVPTHTKPKNSYEGSSEKLKRLVGPSVFTFSCCGLVHLYAEPFCRYLFPKTSTRDQFLQDLFNPISTSRRQKEMQANPAAIWWKSKSNLEKLVWGIVFINGFVLFAFRFFPALQPMMSRLFIAGPRYSVLGIPLAMFTHLGAVHFGFNSYALTSFGPAFRSALSESDFLKLYLHSGIVANYVVVVSKILAGSYAYAMVGASAAIYGLIGFISQAFPEKQIGIILLSDLFPQISFKLRDAPLLLLCVDGIGLMSTWLSRNAKRANFIAHEAHLAGLFFGLAYYHWMARQISYN